MSERDDHPLVRSWLGAVIVRFFQQLPLSGLWVNQVYPADGQTRSGILTGQIEGKGSYPTAYGGYCDVWKCSWRKDSGAVELKSIRMHGSDLDREGKSKRLSTAIEGWLGLDHENVIPIFGMTLGFGPLPALVCPWMKNGTLTRYLEQNYHQTTASTRKAMLLEIISAVLYLHHHGVIHGSLSGSNIFINDLGRACVADFGMATLLLEFSSETYFSSSIGGAVRWIGPELFQVPDESSNSIGFPSTQGDVYSFGCIMLQVLSGKVPYHYFQRDAQVFFAISTGVTPLRPDSSCVNDTQWSVIQQCWLAPQQRPSMEKLHSRINELEF
ncbi:kinase-like domain-containing protein [Suillus subalutaceus]|uniref:kinase-like domain-containing protein n=1 Tax=Suillus subalutaceus TaxID=48586 RepID=UPI001B86F89A|nr:kinase-like domain-containing protein [Suillus subalutaceus]KAG1853480.1 kinase-like domain-containing protein [Suillus subalutaceus]